MPSLRDHVKALNAERIQAHKALNDHFDACQRAHPGQPMNTEERNTETRIQAKISGLEAEIHRFVDQDRREEESAAIHQQYAGAFGSGDAFGGGARSQANDLLRAMASGAIDPSTGRRYSCNLDLSAEMARAGGPRNALYYDTGSAGSVIPRSMAASLYGYLEASSGMLRAPTTKITSAGGELMDFPRFASHAIGTQVIAQGTALAGTDPTFDKMTLGAYKYGQIVKISAETVQDASVDIVDLVLRDLGRGLGRLVDTALVTGSGTGQPRGVITATGLSGGAGTVATGGSEVAATYEHLVDAVHQVADEYRHADSCGWLMKDSTIAQIRKLRDGAGGTIGSPLWEPSLTSGLQNGQPDRLLGFPVYGDPNVAAQASAAKSVWFGDFSAYYIRMAGQVRLERSDDFAFDTDMVALRAIMRVDGNLIDDKASTVISNRVA